MEYVPSVARAFLSLIAEHDGGHGSGRVRVRDGVTVTVGEGLEHDGGHGSVYTVYTRVLIICC